MSKKGNQATLLPLAAEPPAAATPEDIPPELRAVFCEWKFYTEELDFAALPKKITYLLTASGTRVVRKTPVGVVIEELQGEPLIPLPLQPLNTGLILSTPRVPWEVLRTIVAFFREVAKTMKTEALVRIYLHKRTGEWELRVPTQDVGAGSVRVDEKWTFDAAGEYIHVMDIHSHVEMDAFFSGTDDADEKRAVRLYGVIGKVSSPQPHSSWRMWTGFDFLDLNLTDVVAVPAAQFNFPVKRTLGQLLEGDEKDKTVQVDLSKFDPFAGAEFPKEWLTALSERKGGTVYDGWEDDFDARSWQGWGGRTWQSGNATRTPYGWVPPYSRHPAVEAWQKEDQRGDADAFLTRPGGRFQQLREATTYAQLHTQKLVYVVLGDKVTRILPNGSTKPTKMTRNSLQGMAKTKGSDLKYFDLTPPGCE